MESKVAIKGCHKVAAGRQLGVSKETRIGDLKREGNCLGKTVRKTTEVRKKIKSP